MQHRSNSCPLLAHCGNIGPIPRSTLSCSRNRSYIVPIPAHYGIFIGTQPGRENPAAPAEMVICQTSWPISCRTSCGLPAPSQGVLNCLKRADIVLVVMSTGLFALSPLASINMSYVRKQHLQHVTVGVLVRTQ